MNFNLHTSFAWAGLEVEDETASDEAVHFKIDGINKETLSQVIVQLSQEGHPLPPESAIPGKTYILPDNISARIIGATTEKGTPVINLSYERPASATFRARR